MYKVTGSSEARFYMADQEWDDLKTHCVRKGDVHFLKRQQLRLRLTGIICWVTKLSALFTLDTPFSDFSFLVEKKKQVCECGK